MFDDLFALFFLRLCVVDFLRDRQQVVQEDQVRQVELFEETVSVSLDRLLSEGYQQHLFHGFAVVEDGVDCWFVDLERLADLLRQAVHGQPAESEDELVGSEELERQRDDLFESLVDSGEQPLLFVDAFEVHVVEVVGHHEADHPVAEEDVRGADGDDDFVDGVVVAFVEGDPVVAGESSLHELDEPVAEVVSELELAVVGFELFVPEDVDEFLGVLQVEVLHDVQRGAHVDGFSPDPVEQVELGEASLPSCL